LSLARLLLVLATPLPWVLKRLAYRAAGFDVDPTARVGFSYLDVRQATLAQNTRIGHLNVLRRGSALRLGPNSSIGNLNLFRGSSERDAPNRLDIEANVAITSRHYFDLSAGIKIGHGSVVAGRETQIWTHELRNRVDAPEQGPGLLEPVRAPVVLEPRVYIGARCTILPGTVMPAACTLGAGSVLSHSPPRCPPESLIAGNPAALVREGLGESGSR
jgi:acetyltransferase-like isoleucine patch superfamily enzyme